MIMYIEMLCLKSDITHMQLMRGSRKFCKRKSNFDNDDGPKLIVQGIQTRIAKKSFIFVISRGIQVPLTSALDLHMAIGTIFLLTGLNNLMFFISGQILIKSMEQ